MTRISFYTQAEFGSKSNLKTNEAFSMVKALKPDRVFCRDFKFAIKDDRYERIIFGGSFLPKIVTFVNLLSKQRFSLNRLQWKLLDFCSSLRNDNSGLLVFHPPKFKKTIMKYSDKIRVGVLTSNFKDKEMIKNCEYVIAISSYLKDCLMNDGFCEENVFVARQGVDTKKFYPAPHKKRGDTFIALCVADFTLQKGVEYLLEAWAQSSIKGELWLVGNKTKEVQDLIKKYADKRIKDVPFTKNIRDTYQRASVFILPSSSDGWGNVVSEAMSCGLPVIVTESTGAKDAVIDGENGFVIPIKHKGDIGARLFEYYQNPDLCKKHGKNARKQIRNFTWDNFEKEFRTAIENIKEREDL